MCHDIDMSLKVDLKPVDIEVYVVNDIVRAGCMKRLAAGVQVVPHAIFTEQLIKLSAGQLLCIFVLLSTEYHKFSLRRDLSRWFSALKPLIVRISYFKELTLR